MLERQDDVVGDFRRKGGGTMRAYRWLSIALMASVLSGGVGCKSYGPSRTVVSPEPPLAGPVGTDGGVTVADGTRDIPPPKSVTWVDRHPLFYKPRDYYDSSGNNTLVKVGAATFVGVPVGFFYEVKQIVIGNSPEPRF
jgi:hypothetical protein